MVRINFVVSVRAEQHQMAQIGLRQKILDQIESCQIDPLQIVEKQSQRMLLPREHSDKLSKNELESALGFLQRKFGDWWRLSDDELQFRNEVHDELSVRTQRIMKGRAPFAQFRFAFAQKGTDKILEGLR